MVSNIVTHPSLQVGYSKASECFLFSSLFPFRWSVGSDVIVEVTASQLSFVILLSLSLYGRCRSKDHFSVGQVIIEIESRQTHRERFSVLNWLWWAYCVVHTTANELNHFVLLNSKAVLHRICNSILYNVLTHSNFNGVFFFLTRD